MGVLLKALPVNGVTPGEVFFQALGGPDAELRTLERFYPIAHRNNDIEVVVINLVGFPVIGSCRKFCDNCLFGQFALFKHVIHVLADGFHVSAKEFGELLAIQPHRVLLQSHLNGALGIMLVNCDFGLRIHTLTPPAELAA